MKNNFKKITQNPFHPTIPEEYIYETNYKNIPSEYLEKKIPKGRGMIKWQPMATTPQLYSNVNKMIEKQDYVVMPELTDEEIYLNSLHLQHYLNLRLQCTIKYFESDSFMILNCVPYKYDKIKGLASVELLNYNLKKDINIKNIIEVY